MSEFSAPPRLRTSRHLRALLLLGPVVLAVGIVMLSLARSLETMLLARMIMGVGQSKPPGVPIQRPL